MSVSHFRWHVLPALAAAASSLAGHSSGFVYNMAAAASAAASPISPTPSALLRDRKETAAPEAEVEGLAHGGESGPGHGFAENAWMATFAAPGPVERKRRRRGRKNERISRVAGATATGGRKPFGGGCFGEFQLCPSSSVPVAPMMSLHEAGLPSCPWPPFARPISPRPTQHVIPD